MKCTAESDLALVKLYKGSLHFRVYADAFLPQKLIWAHSYAFPDAFDAFSVVSKELRVLLGEKIPVSMLANFKELFDAM